MNEFNGLQVGVTVEVARRVGEVLGLKTEREGKFVYIQYADGYAQWVPLQ